MTWSKDSWNHHEDTRCRPGRETRERRGVGGANDCQRIADGEPRGSRFEGILSQEFRIRGINVLWTIQVQTTSPLVAQAEFPGGCEFAFNREIGLFRVAVFEVFGQRQGERQNRKRESCRQVVLVGEERTGSERIETLLIRPVTERQGRRECPL